MSLTTAAVFFFVAERPLTPVLLLIAGVLFAFARRAITAIELLKYM